MIYEQELNLFPIEFNNKLIYSVDCDDLFLAFYHDKEEYEAMGCVRIDSETVIYPDGSIEQF